MESFHNRQSTLGAIGYSHGVGRRENLTIKRRITRRNLKQRKLQQVSRRRQGHKEHESFRRRQMGMVAITRDCWIWRYCQATIWETTWRWEGGYGMSHAETVQREDKVVTTKETSWTCLVGCQRRGKETWDITVTVGQLDMRWRTTTRTRQCILVI